MTRSLLPALALVTALAVGCTSPQAAPTPTPAPTSTETPTAEPTDAPVVQPIVASYAPGAPTVALPEGWTVADCEGDAPLLCVGREGSDAVVGVLMFDSFPLDSGLAAADDREAVLEALRANAQQRMESLVEDRAIGCGPRGQRRPDGRPAGGRSGGSAVRVPRRAGR